jgi:TRAP-type C4-dicarboxylate transport system substrate-binding protein
MNRKPIGRWAAAVGTVTLVAACSATPSADKSGGDTVVLKLATIDHVNNNGQSYGPQAFVDNLEKVSDGRIKVEVTEEYGQGEAEAESDLVEAIAAGDVDGGWPSSRAFANAGIAGLEAVEAPMTLTSYAAEKALVSGPVADKLLAQLDGTGVVGLSLAVGPLRRPFAAEAPLLELEDWKGVTFRVYNSPIQTDAVRLLGATPVNLGLGWIDELQAGRLRGVEFDIAQYAQMGETPEAGYVTSNVVLWPKVFVLSINKERFNALTDKQQDWVQEAADKAMQASVDATYDETTIARELCGKGTRFVSASPDQIAELRTSLAPVLDGLAADPDDGELLADVQTVAAANAAPDIPDVPTDCQQGAIDDDANLGAIPEEVSELPDGEYRVEITTADVAGAGLSNGPGWSGTWTLTVRQGTFELRCRPVEDPGVDCGTSSEPQDEPFEAGEVLGTGNMVYLVNTGELMSQLTGCKLPPSSTEPEHCGPATTSRMTWVLDGDGLRFGDQQGSENLIYVIEPWQKIS